MSTFVATTLKSWGRALVRLSRGVDQCWLIWRSRLLPPVHSQRLLVKDFAFLQQLPVGTARVEGVIATSQTTVVLLHHFNGMELLIDFPGLPAPDIAGELARSGLSPVAVLMQRLRDRIDCSVLCATAYGPRRVPLSTGAALALCATGCHAVLRCEPTTECVAAQPRSVVAR
jgi:hypothetical protein